MPERLTNDCEVVQLLKAGLKSCSIVINAPEKQTWSSNAQHQTLNLETFRNLHTQIKQDMINYVLILNSTSIFSIF